MKEVYLTASEILAIDKLNEETFLSYLRNLPQDKREMASHVFSKNRAARLLQNRLNEADEGIKRLVGILKDNGISYAG